MNYEYCDGITHTIKKGDTLYEISRMHNVPLSMLLRANPYVDVFNLQVGDTICIPAKGASQKPFSVVKPMPDQNGKENDRMPDTNNMMEMNKEPEKDDGKMKWKKYVVKPGDTLLDVLQQNADNKNAFLEKNGLATIYMLPGVAYYIPDK